MLYGLLGSLGVSGLLLFLYIKSAIANGKLRYEILELKREVAIMSAQLKIGAKPLKSPDELLKMMKKGEL